MPRERILAERELRERGQAVERLAHVDAVAGDVDAHGRR
jgi:hypothetical protein